MITSKWKAISEVVYYAFQPIVNIHTGTTFGFEALLRGYEEAGFSSIHHLLDTAYEDKALYALDLSLREKAINGFIDIGLIHSTRLFYNIDNRVLQMPDYLPGNTQRILSQVGLNPGVIYFELSEKYELSCCKETIDILQQYRKQNYHLVLDDFGTGYSGLKSIYDSHPDIIKIDRFFIADIDSDNKKRVFVANIVDMAHYMGIRIIAEGVESVREFFVCREIGCDYIQGFLIQKPSEKKEHLLKRYPLIEELVSNHKRVPKDRKEKLSAFLDVIPPIHISVPIVEVLSKFRENPELACFPIINGNNEPLGLLSEKKLKYYVYSPFGISILQNKTYGNHIRYFLDKAPILEITTPLEKILEYHAMEQNSEAVIITEDGRYCGVLSSKRLLQLLYEKEITTARDQNPLSKLPGNNIINEVIAKKLHGGLADNAFIYFDFNHFKPFNDTYGFRQGDRVIILFSDILREARNNRDLFIGHIGGDDFIMIASLGKKTFQQLLQKVREIIFRFNSDVRMFYPKRDIENGHITAMDRDGVQRSFPLLTVSAGVVYFSQNISKYGMINFSRKIASLKKIAKKSPHHLSYEIVSAPAIPSIRKDLRVVA
jgi:diguanylate cyclase (GGDEF)-like protein